MSSLYQELKRRKVFRVAVAYAVVAWVLIQISGEVLPALQMPEWTVSFVTVLLLLGFPVALLLGWAFELTPDGVVADTGIQSAPTASNSTDRKLIYAILAIVVLGAGFQVADRLTLDTVVPVPLVNSQADTARVSLVLPVEQPMFFGGNPTHSFAISPDGKTVAYVSANLDGDGTELNIRRLGTLETQSLPGAERARQPFFSPDGQWLGFFTIDGALKKVSLGGGQAVTILDDVNAAGWSFATWMDNNQIVFEELSVLKSVSADGGEVSTLITEPDSSGSGIGIGYRYPEAIFGTNVVLFANGNRVENQFRVKIEAFNTSTGERKVILENAEFPKYIGSGHLLFRQNGVNLVAPFDPILLEFTGPAVALTDEMRRDGSGANGIVSQLAISRNGTLAYVPSISLLRKPYLVNRDGSREALDIRQDLYTSLDVSSDDQYVALAIEQGDEGETYLYDLRRQTTTRLSQDSDAYPFWRPDNQAIVVVSDASPRGLWLKQLNGNQRLLAEFEEGRYILRNGSWHPNGRQFAVTRQAGDEHDIMLLTVDEEITIEPLFDSRSRDHSPRFSPDGNWLAYVSNKSGQDQIYIRRFPDGEEFIVSNGRRNGGPLWSTDGTELFFTQIKEGGNVISTKMSAVTITEIENGTQISQPLDLFPMYTRSQTGVVESYSSSSNGHQRYGLLTDGRFLMLNGSSGLIQNEIVLVQNWFEELRRLAPPDPQ